MIFISPIVQLNFYEHTNDSLFLFDYLNGLDNVVVAIKPEFDELVEDLKNL